MIISCFRRAWSGDLHHGWNGAPAPGARAQGLGLSSVDIISYPTRPGFHVNKNELGRSTHAISMENHGKSMGKSTISMGHGFN